MVIANRILKILYAFPSSAETWSSWVFKYLWSYTCMVLAASEWEICTSVLTISWKAKLIPAKFSVKKSYRWEKIVEKVKSSAG